MHELIGRERELAVLAGCLDRAADGSGTGLVVSGEPGIGKSGLLAATAREAGSRGWTALTTRGVESEASLPFAALHQLLGPVLPAAGLLPDRQREALLSAFGLHESHRPEPMLISVAVTGLITRLAARRPVVLIADDVHWFDPQSHETLAFVARRATDAPIVVIGGCRPGHPGPLIASRLPTLEVGGVDDIAAAAILRRSGSELTDVERRRVLDEARGNPLALLELPLTARRHDPPGSHPVGLTARLEHAFAGRFAELPSGTRDTLLVAACDSTDTLAEIVAAAGALAGQSLVKAVLVPATQTGLVHVADGRVGFRHPLVRSAILQTEGLTRRLAAHAAIAGVAADEHRRVWHRAQSIVGRDDAVADALDANVAMALNRGAVGSAIQYLERAAQLTGSSGRRGHRLLRAAEYAFGLGQRETVARLLQSAAQLGLSDLDTARLEWLREIFSDGTPGDAVRVAQLCAIATAAGDCDLALNLLLGAALRCWWADTGPAARTQVVTAVESLTDCADDPRYVAALAVAEPLLRCHEVLRRLARVQPATSDADALRLYGMAAHAVGDEVRAADFLAAAATRLRDQGRLGLLPQVLSMTVQVCLELGDWTRAQAAAQEGRKLAEQTGQPIWSTGTIACDARADALRGNNDHALLLATRAELAASPGRLNDLLAVVQLARGAICFSEDRFDDAYRELRRMFDPADPSFHRRERFAGVMFLAEAAAYAGRIAEIAPVMQELERIAAAETPSPLLAVHLLYARAVLAPDHKAEALFLVGLGSDLSRWPWVRSRLQLEYGRWLCRQDRRRAARPVLRDALATLETMDARAWERHARQLLALTATDTAGR